MEGMVEVVLSNLHVLPVFLLLCRLFESFPEASGRMSLGEHLMCSVFQESMIRDMAEALTQWGQLNTPQGDVPEKHRNLVLLGKHHPGPHPVWEFTQCGTFASSVPRSSDVLRFKDS